MELTAHQIDIECYIDVYKSIHGFKPRHIDFSLWDSAKFRTELEALDRQAEREAAWEAKCQDDAIKSFEDEVQIVCAAGAGDRATAIRWIRQANNDQMEEHNDSFFEHCRGLPEGYLAAQK